IIVQILLWGLFYLFRSPPPEDSESRRSRDVEIYAAQGDFSRAEANLNRLIKDEEKREANGIATAGYLRRLARLKMDQGDPAAAISILERVLFVQEMSLGARSPDLLQTLEWLAQLEAGRGNL